MYTPEKETARPDQERAVNEAMEAGNLKCNGTTLASRKLFAEAGAIGASISFMMTRKHKHEAGSRVLGILLAALAAGRQERLV
jgi:hypothetical protein